MWFLTTGYSQLIWSRNSDVIGSCDLCYRAATLRGERSQVSLTGESQQLLDNLRRMQVDAENTRSHIVRLVEEVQLRQAELDEREKYRATIKIEIDEKLKEVEAWRDLSETQKNLVLATAKEAVNRKTSIQIAGVIIGSIILNLAANVVWSLMGQPSDQRFKELWESFRHLFG
jgi:hypothetical protein